MLSKSKRHKIVLHAAWVTHSVLIVVIIIFFLQYFIESQEGRKVEISTESREERAVFDIGSLELLFFTRTSGNVYYSTTCEHGIDLNTEDIIWFVSEDEARRRGYEQAKRCSPETD